MNTSNFGWQRAFAVCLAISSLTSSGCVTARISGGSRVTSGYPITSERAEFIETGATTRAEVQREFGGVLNRPTWTWLEQRGVAYTWTTTNGAMGYFIPGDPNASWVQETDHAFCVVFDESERVVRIQHFEASSEAALRSKVDRWIGSSDAYPNVVLASNRP